MYIWEGFFGSIFHDKIKHISKRGSRGLGPPVFWNKEKKWVFNNQGKLSIAKEKSNSS